MIYRSQMTSSFVDIKELSLRQPILKSIDLNLCINCKATQLLCGINYCPLLKALDLYPQSTAIETISTDGSVFGPAPQVFVGSRGYPQVLSGPLTSMQADEGHATIASDPSKWVDLGFKEIIGYRFGLLRGKQPINVRSRRGDHGRLREKLMDVTLSSKPVEIEGRFNSISQFNFTVQPGSQPMGPSGNLEKFELTSNPKIPRRVDSVIGDELRTVDQMLELYNDKFSIYYLQGILSSGVMGKAEKTRIVPTRWAITSVDDTVGKELIQTIKHLPSIDQIEVRHDKLLGNYYTVIFMPGNFTFENIEAWFPGNIFSLKSTKPVYSVNREGFGADHRKRYASQAGGYYASRLAVLEHLLKRGRQARIFVIREITPEYIVPVGVWQVREGMRLTMQNKPVLFADRDECKSHIRSVIKSDFDIYLGSSWTFFSTTIDDYF